MLARKDHWMSVRGTCSVRVGFHAPTKKLLYMFTGVVKAFDEAWQLDKGNCPKYYYSTKE